MRNSLLLIVLAWLLTSSCQTSKQYVHKTSRTPNFIADIYMAPHQKKTGTTDIVDTKKYPIAKATEAVVAKVESAKDGETFISPSAVKEYTPMPKTYSFIRPKAPNLIQAPCVDEPIREYQNPLTLKYADLLGIQTNNISNPTLYQFIEKWYGSTYRLGGSDETGIDCSGFAKKLYNEIYGIDLNRTAKEQFSTCKRLKHPKEAVEGDLVFFHVHSRRITHVGVYLANNYFVHASSSQGVVISNLKDEYWRKYYAGCGRITKS